MSNNRAPPAFPVPNVSPPAEDDLSNRLQRMHFAPPAQPPPGWGGGFNLPMSTLIHHDPYLSVNNPYQSGPNKPLPPPPPANNSNARPQPPAQYPGSSQLLGPPMAMPIPTHYPESSSAPSLSATGKAHRRNSLPQQSVSVPPTSPPSPSGSKKPPKRRRTGSESGEIQCSGMTKAGKRCGRTVKAAPPVTLYTDPDEPVERYCFQHSKEILAQTGFFSKKKTNLALIQFDAWIANELQDETKVALRAEMERPVSNADEDGYIYCFEIINDSTPGYAHFKVGRSNNIIKRLDTWGKQCASKAQIPRGRWPAAPDGSMLKGKMDAGEKGPYCHRLEKLIHLELADLAKNTPYLDPGWHRHTAHATSSNATPPAAPMKKGKGKAADARMSGKECPDCGKVHKEIFTFAKMTGEFENREWEKVVWPAMEKWGMFVEQCL